MAFIFSIFSGSNGHSDRDSPATSRWPNTIQLCVMGSFRSSIQVSLEVLALPCGTQHPHARRLRKSICEACTEPSRIRVVCFSPPQLSSKRLRDSKSLVFLPAGTPSFGGPDRPLIFTTPSHSLFSGPAALPWFLIPIVFPRAILRPNMEIVGADISFMQLALEEARAAMAAGEVPIGA